MLRVRSLDRSLSETDALRRWVNRETPKREYPNADPSTWDAARLVDELESQFDEPAGPAVRGSPEWTVLRVSGRELGSLAAFPACGWDALSEDGPISTVVDRLQTEALAADFPDATEKIATFRELAHDERLADVGALVARQSDDDWPPVLLEGNHRASGAHWAAREGATVELDVHLAHERPLAELPIETGD